MQHFGNLATGLTLSGQAEYFLFAQAQTIVSRMLLIGAMGQIILKDGFGYRWGQIGLTGINGPDGGQEFLRFTYPSTHSPGHLPEALQRNIPSDRAPSRPKHLPEGHVVLFPGWRPARSGHP